MYVTNRVLKININQYQSINRTVQRKLAFLGGIDLYTVCCGLAPGIHIRPCTGENLEALAVTL